MTPAPTGKIIVKPRKSHGWTIVTARSHSELFFQTRRRALQFARAYAKLNPPVTLQIFDETGALESEENFEGLFQAGGG